MPPRRSKAKAVPATVAKKRPAEDASQSAPAAKKARQSVSKVAAKAPHSAKVAPAAEVIELSSDEEDSVDDGKRKAASSKKAAAASADNSDDSDDDSNEDEDGDQDDAEEGETKGGIEGLPPKVRQRLEYIATHTDGLTGTYLKMIISDLPGRFLGKGGCNADLAVDIANHCGYEAQAGRSDLLLEKLLIKRVYGMCYGACRDSESEGEADSDDEYGEPYIIPQEVKNRLMYCCNMLEAFDLKALRQTMKKLPKYNGRRKGELYNVFSDVIDHLDDLAARKADVVAETAMIEKIQTRFTARKKADDNDDDEY